VPFVMVLPASIPRRAFAWRDLPIAFWRAPNSSSPRDLEACEPRVRAR